MKPLKLASILAFSIVIIQAWRPLKPINGNFENTSELLIFQNGVEKTVGGFNETMEIDRKEFFLRFYNKRYDAENDKFYSAQIAAFITKLNLIALELELQRATYLVLSQVRAWHQVKVENMNH